ncbi:hypothetical protein HHK36_019750 [Tetracentron sinense]|uniref:Uncharacterized protein n=1 Tax=Tetracentron sinense TaxID=13715 RepID=A0A834Z1W0_TETSI|nr:hypothetical protein HHK36_019750 [Tetracentron sinense]
MVESEKSKDMEEGLKPFYQRAIEAEISSGHIKLVLLQKNAANEELSKNVNEIQSKLEQAKAEQTSEREKALKEVQKLAAENAKLQYRISHLVRALKEADCKLET